MGWHGEVQLCIIKQKQNTFLGKYRTFSLITMHTHISVAQEAATMTVPSWAKHLRHPKTLRPSLCQQTSRPSSFLIVENLGVSISWWCILSLRTMKCLTTYDDALRKFWQNIVANMTACSFLQSFIGAWGIQCTCTRLKNPKSWMMLTSVSCNTCTSCCSSITAILPLWQTVLSDSAMLLQFLLLWVCHFLHNFLHCLFCL